MQEQLDEAQGQPQLIAGAEREVGVVGGMSALAAISVEFDPQSSEGLPRALGGGLHLPEGLHTAL